MLLWHAAYVCGPSPRAEGSLHFPGLDAPGSSVARRPAWTVLLPCLPDTSAAGGRACILREVVTTKPDPHATFSLAQRTVLDQREACIASLVGRALRGHRHSSRESALW